MSELQYIDKGNALEPIGEGKKLIIHCCNDKGGWGSGFVVALSKKWTLPEERYRAWADKGSWNDRPFKLGFIQAVLVEDDLAVVNMIGQHKTGHDEHGFPPVRYYAVDECFKEVAKIAKKHNASVHVPYLMCCDLAGGEWDYIEVMLKKRFLDEGIDVYVYDIKGVRQNRH